MQNMTASVWPTLWPLQPGTYAHTQMSSTQGRRMPPLQAPRTYTTHKYIYTHSTFGTHMHFTHTHMTPVPQDRLLERVQGRGAVRPHVHKRRSVKLDRLDRRTKDTFFVN